IAHVSHALFCLLCADCCVLCYNATMFKDLIRSPSLRRRTSWVVAAVLILPLVLFFHAAWRNPEEEANASAGVVFGRSVSWDTFQEHLVWVRRQWENRLGQLPEGIEPLLVRQTWDRILLLEEARRRKIRVSDQDLLSLIHQIPATQEDGKFLRERYYFLLRAMGTTPQAFESMLRQDLLMERLIGKIREEVTVTEEEIRTAYNEQREKTSALLFIFKPSAYEPAASEMVTDETLRKAYDLQQRAIGKALDEKSENGGAEHREEYYKHNQKQRPAAN
ncbi:MAG: SurA N-terminal domain-containing protein, partial [Candidatus Omnitrophica bacterium]|nr:SurA N-terminal domain-containing protein [Candidatus Omnitrophota bacterium]